MLSDGFSTVSQWERLFITAALYACLASVAALGLTVVIHHHPQFQSLLLLSLCAAVYLELGFFPRRSLLFIPYLLVWSLWLVERVVLGAYWHAVNNSLYEAVPLVEHQYAIAFAVQLTCSWLTVGVPALRRGWTFFFLTALAAAAYVAQWSPPHSEWMTVLQAGCFSLLYLLSIVVVACFQQNESGLYAGALRVVQSAWCLSALNPAVLLVAASIQGMMGIAVIGQNIDSLRFLNVEFPVPVLKAKEKETESESSFEEY